MVLSHHHELGLSCSQEFWLDSIAVTNSLIGATKATQDAYMWYQGVSPLVEISLTNHLDTALEFVTATLRPDSKKGVYPERLIVPDVYIARRGTGSLGTYTDAGSSWGTSVTFPNSGAVRYRVFNKKDYIDFYWGKTAKGEMTGMVRLVTGYKLKSGKHPKSNSKAPIGDFNIAQYKDLKSRWRTFIKKDSPSGSDGKKGKLDVGPLVLVKYNHGEYIVHTAFSRQMNVNGQGKTHDSIKGNIQLFKCSTWDIIPVDCTTNFRK